MGTKYCTKCETLKESTEFSRNRYRRDGLHTECKDCASSRLRQWSKKPETRVKILAKNSERRVRLRACSDPRFMVGRKLSASRELEKRFGWKACTASVDELVPLFTTSCQICSKEVGNAICLDHDHTTGAFRGFLCSGCNSVVGHCGENLEILKRVIEYLSRTF